MADAQSAGDAAAGGLRGRSGEAGAGEAGDGHTSEAICLNCGCRLVGEHCHCCGQQAHVHRTIGAWWHDFLHSVLHVDGKFWRTLPMLVWRPGELTRRYARGERAKFISPLALFLFTVLLMFAVVSTAGPKIGGDFGLSETVEEGLSEEREKLRILQSQRARAKAPVAGELDKQIAETRDDIRRLEDLDRRGVTRAPIVRSGDTVEGDPLFKAIVKKAAENPDLLLYKVQASAYKFSWALIPISVPFVWALFLHRRRYRQTFTAYDHLVFVTYSIAFMSLGLIALVLLGSAGVGGGPIMAAAMLIPPLHMYRQLRGAYDLSRFGAAWRTFALLLFAWIALGLFASLLVALGALG